MSTNSLITQGIGYTYEHLNEAIKQIDQAFNEDGYAKRHPELIGQYLIASAINGSANALISQIDISTSNLSSSLTTMSWTEIAEDGTVK